MANTPIAAPTFGQLNSKDLPLFANAVKGILFTLSTFMQTVARILSKTVTTDGTGTMDAPLTLENVATAGLPSAAASTGGILYNTTLGVLEFSNGSAWFPVGSGGLIGVQTFTTAGTSAYTPTAGANTYVAEVLGGGGGGGGAALTGAAQIAVGGSGAGGGYARKRGLTSAISGATITVGAKGTGGTAGANNGTAGGTSSIGAVVSATGGGGGAGDTAGATTKAGAASGSGGAGSNGDININGQPVLTPILTQTAITDGRPGGNSFYGQGGVSVITGTGAGGFGATGYGGGGSAGANAASQGTGKAGGDGTAGIVIIWEYA